METEKNIEREKIIQEMWMNTCTRGCWGLRGACEKCNGPFMTICNCAREQFINNVKQEDIDEYIKKRNMVQQTLE